MTTPFSWEEWEDKVGQLQRGVPLDRYVVKVRHWRREEARGPRNVRELVQRVALYHSEASPRDRPLAVFEVPAGADLAALEDGATVVVTGWPDPGGAIALEVGGQRVISRTPGELPLFGSPRLGRR
jgi:hypothetical protein